MNKPIQRIWSTMKAMKAPMVNSAKAIAKEFQTAYGGKFLTKPELVGAAMGIAYGTATADYRKGYGNAVQRGLGFGALGLAGGSAYKLFQGGFLNKASRGRVGLGAIGNAAKSTWAAGAGDAGMLRRGWDATKGFSGRRWADAKGLAGRAGRTASLLKPDAAAYGNEMGRALKGAWGGAGMLPTSVLAGAGAGAAAGMATDDYRRHGIVHGMGRGLMYGALGAAGGAAFHTGKGLWNTHGFSEIGSLNRSFSSMIGQRWAQAA